MINHYSASLCPASTNWYTRVCFGKVRVDLRRTIVIYVIFIFYVSWFGNLSITTDYGSQFQPEKMVYDKNSLLRWFCRNCTVQSQRLSLHPDWQPIRERFTKLALTWPPAHSVTPNVLIIDNKECDLADGQRGEAMSTFENYKLEKFGCVHFI